MDLTPAKRRKMCHHRGGSRGSAFALGVKELLKEVTVDYEETFAGASDLLHRIKGSIEKIESHGPVPIHTAAAKLLKRERVRVPFPDPQPASDSNYKVSYAKPAHFNVVGSFVSKTMVRTQKNHAIDMVAVLPEEILQEKDYLDMRYFYKRAYYLAVISAALQRELEESAELQFECLNENPLTPVLVVRAKISGGKKDKNTSSVKPRGWLRIRLIPCAPEGFFPSHKLDAGASLIRKGSAEGKEGIPRHFYSSALKADACFLAYLRLLKQAEKTRPAFKDAVILGRVWLQQRGLGGNLSQGGFGQFEWAVLLALLVKPDGDNAKAALPASLTAVQLFKAMIQYLSITDFIKKPCVLGSSTVKAAAAKEGGPVIYDSVRQLNMAFKMSVGSATMLTQHAKWTHALLADRLADQFSPTFVTKSDVPLQSFDLIAEVNCDAAMGKHAKPGGRGQMWDLSDRAAKILIMGFADRACQVYVSYPSASPWALSAAADFLASRVMRIGVLFDAIHMARKTYRGPDVEDEKEAEKFLALWGQRSELRRFEDGVTRETVMFSGTTAEDICAEMIRYLLQKHLGIGALHSEIKFHGNQLPRMVPIQPIDTTLFSIARKEYNNFEQDVRSLDLPLQVRRLLPACPCLRSTSVKPPLFEFSNSGPRPMDVVVYFEASGKWPDNLEAVQRAKLAFLLKIGSDLAKAKKGKVAAHVGLEDAKTEIENLAFLDVVYETGSSFRLRIHSDLEESLLEKRTKDKTLGQHSRTEAATLLANVKRMYTHLPMHTTSISIMSTHFPALSSTIRLLKHWFDAHKLTHHFSDEFVELAALRVFTVPYPWNTPSSAQAGFLRALLFLSRWDWRSEPLVVDTSGDMTPEDHAAIEIRLEAWRNLDPGMVHTVLFVATSHDISGKTYTTSADGQPKPSKVAATRMTTLARSATRLVREKELELELRNLFASALKDYDVLVRLDQKVIQSLLKTYATDAEEAAAAASGRPQFKSLDERTGQTPLPLAKHPIRVFLEKLDEVYAGALMLFHGDEEDAVVGAIWNPQMATRTFRAQLPCSFKPVFSAKEQKSKNGIGEEQPGEVDDKANDMMEINKEAILVEIARLGGELVQRVEVLRK